MEGYISLSRREKHYYFFYLLLLLLAGLVLLGFLLLRHAPSPFAGDAAYDLQLLDQKRAFDRQQQVLYPRLEEAFNKVDALPLREPQPYMESDIRNGINLIAGQPQTSQLADPRKEAWYQAALFYKMYFEDKKLAGRKSDNIVLFEKQFTECSIGFKDKEQQLAQKKAAILSRNN